jgi:lipopolysaccharide export system permease protein
MRLLDRYCLRELLIPLGYCLGGFLVFWISFELLGELDDLQRAQLRVAEVVQYYLVRLPEMLVTILPVALLLALLYALTNHARHQELTAMRAAGLSLWRVGRPYLAVGAFFGGALFGLNELAVPDGAEAAQAILTRHQMPAADALGPEWRRGLAFHNERDQRIWNIGAYNRMSGEMLSPTVEWRLPDGGRRRLGADRAAYTNGTWVFYGAKELRYAPEGGLPAYKGETNELALAEFGETPAQIASEIKFVELAPRHAIKRASLSLREILDYERLHPALHPRDRAKLRTQFQGRLAEPWKCLVVVLIAMPFGASSGGRNVFVGVASSIFIGFAYFILWSLSFALGTGGYVPPWVAAWGPNALFALAGIALLQRVP